MTESGCQIVGKHFSRLLRNAPGNLFCLGEYCLVGFKQYGSSVGEMQEMTFQRHLFAAKSCTGAMFPIYMVELHNLSSAPERPECLQQQVSDPGMFMGVLHLEPHCIDPFGQR